MEEQNKKITDQETNEISSIDEFNKNEKSNEESIEDDNLESAELIVDEYTVEEKKKIKRSLIKLLIFFIITSIVYYICKIFDPFKNITETKETSVSMLLYYIKYIMIASSIIALVGIFIFILYLLKVKIKIKKNILKRIIDIFEWIVIFPICIMVATFCFSFVFSFTVVDGDSMQPNYFNGDQLFLLYSKKIDRFDTIVIDVDEKYNIYQESLYIKRVIGLPGEYIDYKVEENDNKELITNLYINGEYVEEPFYTELEKVLYPTYLRSFVPFDFEDICEINGLNYQIKDGKIVIPDDYYLVLGDNRTNSKDSRVIGLIHKDDIIGKIEFKVEEGFQFKKAE